MKVHENECVVKVVLFMSTKIFHHKRMHSGNEFEKHNFHKSLENFKLIDAFDLVAAVIFSYLALT